MGWIRSRAAECSYINHYHHFPEHCIGGTACSVCRKRVHLEMNSEITLTHWYRNWKAGICFSLNLREKERDMIKVEKIISVPGNT